MPHLRELVDIGKRHLAEFQRCRVSLAAGGLAYFVALSIVPAALAFGTIAGLIFDPGQVRAALDRMTQRAPEAVDVAAPIVSAFVSTVERASATSFTVTTLVAALVAVYASSKVVQGLRMAMNTVFDVRETRGGLVDRAIAAVITLAGLVLGVGFVTLAVVAPTVLDWMGIEQAWTGPRSGLAKALVGSAAVFLAVRWLFAHAPARRLRVDWTSPAPLVATVGIILATLGVGIYARFSASLGVAVLLFGSAIVALLWVYLCFLALLWGALMEADRQRARTATSTASAVGRRPSR